jgi:hypothetical protein
MNKGNGVASNDAIEVEVERPARRFICAGQEWLAWPSGASAYGTGTVAPAALQAVHFAKVETPETPAFEALLPAGKFYGLFDDELVTLLRRATKVVDPAERPLRPATRRGEGLL